ncbi:hypothetical protein ACIRP5_10115 [Streptomyces sp. NPDC101221]|uniref:hypothetical protein n=1 Tax=Streptomyces sp. NPDC101221 TaxID=3366132 RepID=UPI00380E7A51
MFSDMRLNTTVHLWVEVSDDGESWTPCPHAPEAHETVTNIPEIKAVIRSYTRVAESMGARVQPRPQRFFRVMVQGEKTRIVLAVIPRWWNGSRYIKTGGDWSIFDTPTAFSRGAARYIAATAIG